MTHLNTFKLVCRSLPATCAWAHFPPIFTFVSHLWIGITVFGTISTDFLVQKSRNRFVDLPLRDIRPERKQNGGDAMPVGHVIHCVEGGFDFTLEMEIRAKMTVLLTLGLTKLKTIEAHTVRAFQNNYHRAAAWRFIKTKSAKH